MTHKRSRCQRATRFRVRMRDTGVPRAHRESAPRQGKHRWRFLFLLLDSLSGANQPDVDEAGDPPAKSQQRATFSLKPSHSIPLSHPVPSRALSLHSSRASRSRSADPPSTNEKTACARSVRPCIAPQRATRRTWSRTSYQPAPTRRRGRRTR